MGLNVGALYTLRRLSVTLVVFLLVLSVGVVYAANDVSVTALKAGYLRAGENGLGGTQWVKRVDFNASWWQTQHNSNNAGRVSKYFTKQKPLSAGTIGSLGRKALRGGVYGVAAQIALEQLIDGAGWAFDELQDQVKVPGTPKQDLGTTAYCTSGMTPEYCASAPGGLSTVVHLVNPAIFSQPCQTNGTSNGSVRYSCRRISDGAMINVMIEALRTRPVTGWPGSTVNVNPSTEDVPVSDIDLGERMRERPDLINTLLTDPRTGTPVSTPEMQQMIDELKEEIRNREGFDPQDPTTLPDVNDDTETPNEGTEWPAFCTWASVVCEFIDWVRSDDEQYEKPEVPWDETEPEMEAWSSGIGGGTCPAPVSHTVTIGGMSGTLAFSVQPICDAGVLLKPLVIAIASLLGLYIVGGWRRSANA